MVTAAQVEQIEALPDHQMTLKVLAGLGLQIDDALDLLVDRRLSPGKHQELTWSVGWERVQARMSFRVYADMRDSFDRLTRTLDALPDRITAALAARPAKGKG